MMWQAIDRVGLVHGSVHLMVFAAFLSRRRALTCSFRARHALPHELISCGEASPEAFHFCLSEALGLFGEPLAFQLPRCLSNRSSAVQGKDDRKRSDQSFHVNFPSSVLRTAKSFAPAHARRDRLLLALPMGNYNTASTRRTPCSLIRWSSRSALSIVSGIDGLAFGALIGDTAFDSNDIVADLNERGAKAVIAQHPRRTTPLDIDREMYKWRHLIENFFCKLKEFKRIALRAAARRQNRSELRRADLHRRRPHQLTMNPNRP